MTTKNPPARRKRKNATPPRAERLAWVPTFLQTLADTGNVRASAQAAGVNRATVYKVRAAGGDFRHDWDVAMEDAIDVLEYVARERAVRAKNPSDVLLIFLLKAHRPEKFSDRLRIDFTDDEIRREAERLGEKLGMDPAAIKAEADRIVAAGQR